MEAKNIELREKRNQEEIKKFMDEAAMAKAKFKEKREIKFNIDNIVKEYEKTFKTDKTADQLIDEQKVMEENNKDSKINEFRNINLSYKKGGISNKSNDVSCDENLTSNKNNNIDMNTDNKNSPTKKVELDKISSKFPNCFSNINNKIVYSNIENKNDLLSKKEKLQINENNNNVKDMKPEEQDNDYKLSLKANKSELFDKIKKDQDKTLKIKYDTVALNLVNDRVLKTRIQSAKICDVKEIAPKKNGLRSILYTFICI